MEKSIIKKENENTKKIVWFMGEFNIPTHYLWDDDLPFSTILSTFKKITYIY